MHSSFADEVAQRRGELDLKSFFSDKESAKYEVDEHGHVVTDDGCEVHVWIRAREYSPELHRQVIDAWREHAFTLRDGEMCAADDSDLVVEVYVGLEAAAEAFASGSPFVNGDACLRELRLYQVPHEMAAPPCTVVGEADDLGLELDNAIAVIERPLPSGGSDAA